MRLAKVALLMVAVFMASLALGAGQITVVSPTENAVLGASNNIVFNITNAVTEVTVSATLSGPGGTIGPISQKFQPTVDGKISNGQLQLNLARSLPDGAYVLQVTATEQNNTYNTPPPIDVTVLLTPPKFLDFNPVTGDYVKGIVPISCSVQTSQIKDWKVQINNQDIPNNTGTTTSFVVNWDTTSIPTDGPQTITITVRDAALNTVSQTINVTLDRLAPVITVQYPRADTPLLPHSKVPFLVDIQDASTSSVDVTGIDVILLNMDDTFFVRVPRINVTPVGINVLRWSGRIRPTITLPPSFKLKVTAVDKAGNVAQQQIVVLTTSH